MKKYTFEELKAIFEKYDDSKCYYTDKQRQAILGKASAEQYLDRIKVKYADYTKDMTVALPFTSFKRFYKDGDRKEGEYWYYYNRRKLGTVALMAWLYGEQEYYNELENILWAIMDEYVWNIPAHVGPTALTDLQQDNFTIDLFSAETCFTIAEIIAHLGDKIEPIITKRALRMIDERCFDVFDKPFPWKKEHNNNHAAVCGGEVGMAALYVKKDPAELAKIIHSCLETMESYLAGLQDDGACTEGLGYWGYGFGYYTYFGELLYRRTHGEVNIFDDEKVRKIASFQRKCFFKGGKYVTFSDCGGSDRAKFNLLLTSILGSFFPEITLPEKDLVEFNFGEGCSFSLGLRTLIWAPETFDGYSLKPETFILPEAQWYMSSTEKGLGLAAKAGYNWDARESHNHNDVGNFIVYKNDANLISDIGAGVYSATYFDHYGSRYENFACSSRGHNVPIIDSEEQKYGENHKAKGTVITEENGLTADIAGAYDIENLESLVRNVWLDKKNECVRLTDTYKFKEAPKSVTERFVSYNEPKIEDGEVTISAKGETLTFIYDKNMLKPVLRVYEDVGNMVRHRDGFKAYMVDFEVINPTTEFTLEFIMK